jgi:hypothetical protein
MAKGVLDLLGICLLSLMASSRSRISRSTSSADMMRGPFSTHCVGAIGTPLVRFGRCSSCGVVGSRDCTRCINSYKGVRTSLHPKRSQLLSLPR